MKYYTGIGSRETPQRILEVMNELAIVLDNKGWTLRSGGADGADSAFEMGAHISKEIYLPWKGFNGNNSPLYKLTPEAWNMAEFIHPAWNRCSEGAKKLHTRNIYQVLGYDLNTPSKMLICWTRDGLEIGGTATAIRLAKSNGIKVINLGNTNDLERVLKYIEES